MNAISVLVLLLFLAGLFFNFSAVVGIIRMPDLYCRLHSSSKNTTLGSLLIVAGLAIREFQAGEGPAGLKVLLIGTFLLVVTPIGSHALARAAYKYGVPLWEGTICDQYAEAQGRADV
jgi:multicomponent Na+:H+ antiporter subunit G